ncbi:sensor domain-containing diguanylate cyclase [Paralcaligenes sp. KSB-10]|uniref:sensor domain-containing diguanylate cyclase n=1 Tax=Paralcaligenes sp. KSB-10 TaxID=2901142 RepID=UPI001E54FB79|nr:sensor domain-containing diguanylate cyclase [Paralcaligenes sp. KSB-10]UHL65391.1 sensor domain-containing diguanylate cyclase [Paralcaligenes sp. KSB-10]
MKTTCAPSILSRLVLLATACIVPASLMAVLLITYDYHQARTQLTHNSMSTARAMVLAVDRDFASTESTLIALATSPYLSTQDYAAFYRQASEILRDPANIAIALSDAAGKQYLNTIRPYGAPLPRQSNSRQLQRVAETQKTVISNLFVGPVTRRPLAVMGVPVVRKNKAIYNLSAGMFAEHFSKLLAQQTLPPNWIGTIVDKSGTIVATTHDTHRLTGMQAPLSLIKHMTLDHEGSFENTTLAGAPALTVFSQSPISGWTIAIEIPTQSLDSALWDRFFWLIFATAALLAGSLGFAWLIGGKIARSVRGLASPALALGRGEPVKPSSYHLKEADEVGLALVKASEMLFHARHQANHDLLTKLSNRSLFTEIVDQQLRLLGRIHSHMSILYIDLDGFKAVNDEHGHAAGDKLLRLAAERLKAGIRESDVAARLGGDEFSVLLVNASMADAEMIAKKLAKSLSVPYQLDTLSVEVSASIGVASFPESGTTSKALLHSADHAMYKAKAMGKGCVVAEIS